LIIDGADKQSGIQITGMPGRPLEGIRLQNIRVIYKGGGSEQDAARVFPELGTGYPEPSKLGTCPAWGLFARHIKGLELADINLSVKKDDQRPALICDDVEDLEIDNFKAKNPAAGVTAAKMTDTKDVVIRNSPALKDAAK
jgi:hypothetical protein